MHSWQQKSLGDFIELKRGYDLPSRDRLPGEFPLVTSSGPTEYISQSKAKGPGVVTGRYGTVGQVFYVQKDFWPLNTALYVRDFRGNNPRFVYYFLHGIDWEKFNDKSGVPGINRNDVHREPVFVPPLDQQTQIVSVLGALDDKIELNRRMNETLEAMAQAIFRDWFVDFGPVRRKLAGATDPAAIMGGLMPDPARATELAGLFPGRFGEDGLPAGWSGGVASDLIEFNPKEPLRRGVLAPYSDMSSLPTRGSCADAPVMREFGSGMRFRNGDALLARITPCLENGKSAFVDMLSEGSVGWGSTEFIVLRSRQGTPPPLGYLLCRDPEFRAHAIQSMTGTSGRQRAQADSLTGWPMAIPPPTILSAFGDYVVPFFARISANSAENRTLAEARDYLLPRLMSGEVRVGEPEAEAA